LDAVSGDKLDTGKIAARGWKKEGIEKTPLGEASVYQLANNSTRIVAHATPSGFCTVDAYGQAPDQFDAFQAAIASELKTEFGQNGITDQKFADPSNW
jgi:hypothetical protein